ncbi:DNA adenine methylase [Helicobacter cappadocius]|uniref:site-specific DNA-methyltransferase (adenine-specific) n=1 Tax=Helicobacter cappadocius TaxID=3063998 RepID=A0AA90SRU3_9HELI|nr:MULTISPECIES: DNA adenine methylase [unclassified Helicobacter]MDO7252337.1 DNA adenine methylase [Helicobacter sp. faydin-H75]MDP2538204.1 DNA adenine methylase [Helicobacter sp. faydin-H76]
MIKPMLKYRGGKSAEINQIIPFFPTSYKRYIEPFFGGGALYFFLSPKKSIINDLNKPLMNFYTSVRNDFLSLKKNYPNYKNYMNPIN